MNLGTFAYPRPKPGRHAPYPWGKLSVGSFFLVRPPLPQHHYSSRKGNKMRATLKCSERQYRRDHDPDARFNIRWERTKVLVVERIA